MYRCTSCREVKDDENFSFRTKSGKVTGYCKPCNSKRNQAKRFNISLESLDELLSIDNCQSCGKQMDGRSKHIDHCHKSGRIRGVLCRGCNLALGHVNDDKTILLNLINYICN